MSAPSDVERAVQRAAKLAERYGEEVLDLVDTEAADHAGVLTPALRAENMSWANVAEMIMFALAMKFPLCSDHELSEAAEQYLGTITIPDTDPQHWPQP